MAVFQNPSSPRAGEPLDQNEKCQLDGQVLDRVITDKASGRDTTRRELAELLRFTGDGDIVAVHSMDRLARNLDDLRSLVQGLPPAKACAWSSSMNSWSSLGRIPP
jgi:hypothetical protein